MFCISYVGIEQLRAHFTDKIRYYRYFISYLRSSSSFIIVGRIFWLNFSACWRLSHQCFDPLALVLKQSINQDSERLQQFLPSNTSMRQWEWVRGWIIKASYSDPERCNPENYFSSIPSKTLHQPWRGLVRVSIELTSPLQETTLTVPAEFWPWRAL